MPEPLPMSPDNPILVEVVREDLVECVHRAAVVVTGPDGQVVASLGEVTRPMYARSSLKPVQALAMLRAGLDLDGKLLALAAASHSGQDYHLAGVREILGGVGLGVEALQNTPDLPLHAGSRADWVRSGRDAESLTQNCSGKHAAMLRTCVLAGWDPSSYLAVDHPLQQAVAEAVDEYCGSHRPFTVDGCGAPLFATSLAGLARAFGRVAGAADGPERRVAEAFRRHPEYASGEGRYDLALHRAVPGMVAKAGAEACVGIGLADGRGLAIKVDDGGDRAVLPLAATVLQAMTSGAGGDVAALEALRTAPVLGHGRPVGEVRVVGDALAALLAQVAA
ncbi:asparaginase [Aestuariimicrobium sp. Y1814]|uniref:asparaginase n=1 Tax=Aestuariimicrobium sp. Y1814 TaxID=3418742 RepID=UPI003DA75EE2